MSVVYCQGEVSATGCILPQRGPEEGKCVNECDRETLIIKWKFRPAAALPCLTSNFCGTAALPMLTSKLNSKTAIVNFVPACLKPPTSNYFILVHIIRYQPIFTRRTSGHCLGNFRAVTVLIPYNKCCTVFTNVIYFFFVLPFRHRPTELIGI